MMNNRRCHSLRSAAVFPCSLLKLITDLKKVTVRGIESRLRRVRGSRGGVMTGAPEEEEKQHSISVMEISAFMIYYWWSQHEGRPGILSVYVDLVTTGEPGAWCLGPGVSTCELSRAPESGPGLREAATRGRDFSPGPGLSHVTRRGSRVREEAGRRQRYEQVSYNSLAVIQHQERRNPHLWQWLD